VTSIGRKGLETKLTFIDVTRASPSTVERGSGAALMAVLMVCGTSGSPASSSVAIDAWAVTRDRRGSFSDASPLTPTWELLGASVRRPLEGVAAISVSRNGLSKITDVTSLWNHDPL
jgi:hypothetical protein